MSSAAEILLSTRELSCRRTNLQSQRFLNGFLRQMDLEKKMVSRDWDHRMKTFVAQRRKLMPQVWENTDSQRAKTASSLRAIGGKSFKTHLHHHSSPNIPAEWKLCASYKILKSGERVRQPLPDAPKTVSARSVTRRHRPIVAPRNAVSAPAAQRSNPNSFLITQLDDEESELDKLVRADSVVGNDVRGDHVTNNYVRGDDVTNNYVRGDDVTNNYVRGDYNKTNTYNVRANMHKLPPSGKTSTKTIQKTTRHVQPISATRGHSSRTNFTVTTGLKRSSSVDSLSSCSSKSSMGSFTLLNKLTGAQHFT